MQNLLERPRNRRDGPTAFVLNIGLAGLGAVRSLGRAGVPVIGLDPDPGHAGFASRYCEARRCPHPVHEQDALAGFLLGEGRRLPEPGILSPASDAFVLFMSRYRDALRECFRFSLPSPDVMEAAVDKRKLYELADRVGVSHATTCYPETLEDVHRIKDVLEYPVYIKPYYSHMWQVTFPGLGKGIKALTPEDLVRAYERIFPTGVQAMVQSIILGPATNVRTVYAYIAESGETLGAMTTRKIRQYPVEFGRGSMAESFHAPDFMEMGLRFFRDIGYRGFGTVEFKLDDRDGVLKLTDLNPRWVKPICLPVDSGVNFPLIHYLDLAGEAPEAQMTFKSGVRWLDAVSDLASSLPAIRAGELSPSAWARSWLRARSFAAFAMDDWGPFLKEYRYGRRVLRAPLAVWSRLRRPGGAAAAGLPTE
jgi:predicted ATP-grasp superfamily ATP-dependent carboligase